MTYIDSNGVELNDGDYVLSTGDGVGAFSRTHWDAGILRIFRHDDGETGYNISPVFPPQDGSVQVSLSAYNPDDGRFIRLYKIDRESAVALMSKSREAQKAYEMALDTYRRRKAAERKRS